LEAGTSVTYPQVFSAIDDWHFSSNYTYLNAVYLDSFGVQNPHDEESIVFVKSGDRMTGIPEHLLKLALGVDLWHKVTLGVNGLYSGDQFYRGDEANKNAPLAGYWLFNATAEYKVTQHFTVFGKLDNMFDNHYSSFGVYGNASEIFPQFNDGRFVSPAAPQAGWLGVRLTL
jgi:outer membrane receptor for monomeric catechols